MVVFRLVDSLVLLAAVIIVKSRGRGISTSYIASYIAS